MWWPGRENSGGSWLPEEKKANMWPGRGNSGGSWPPAFPRSSETETKERQIIIDRLDKEIKDPNARNLLDTLSLKLLKVITPTEARTMLDKFFIKNNPPTHTHTPTTSKHKY